MKISYYLNSERNKNLYCRISDGSERTTFSLGHYVDPKTWDNTHEDIKWENQYCGVLKALKQTLTYKYDTIKNSDAKAKVEILKNEALSYTENNGLEGIQRQLWNNKAAQKSLGHYDDFISAIEKYSGFNRNKLKITCLEYRMHYSTPDGTLYEIDTYGGHVQYIIDLVEKRDYESIYTQTSFELWNEVYNIMGIKKSKFLPKFLSTWEQFWRDNKSEIPSKSHYQNLKEESWNRFIIFMSCYDDGDPFKLASDLNDFEFGPLFIITMLDIFGIENGLDDYCEYYFNNLIYNWDYFDLSDDDDIKEAQLSQFLFYFREIDTYNNN